MTESESVHTATASVVDELWGTDMPLSPSCMADDLLKLCAVNNIIVLIDVPLAHLHCLLPTFIPQGWLLVADKAKAASVRHRGRPS